MLYCSFYCFFIFVRLDVVAVVINFYRFFFSSIDSMNNFFLLPIQLYKYLTWFYFDVLIRQVAWFKFLFFFQFFFPTFITLLKLIRNFCLDDKCFSFLFLMILIVGYEGSDFDEVIKLLSMILLIFGIKFCRKTKTSN